MKKLNKYISQFLVMLLVFSFITGEYTFAKKQKKGAWIFVTKVSGKQVSGELLVVKEDSILITYNSSGQWEKVELNEILKVRIIKRSKSLLGIGIGVVAGALLGGVLGYADGNDQYDPNRSMFQLVRTASEKAQWGAIGGGLLGGMIGGIVGLIMGIDEKFNLTGEKLIEKKKFLKYLRKYAYDKNY